MGRRYLVLGAVTAGWGTIPVLTGLSHLPSPLVVAIRLWTAALCLGAVLVGGRVRRLRAGVRGNAGEGAVSPTGRGGSGPTACDLAPGVRAGLKPGVLTVQPLRCVVTAAVLGAHWLALFAAYQRAPAGTVILIVYLAPIGVAALAPGLLGERLGRRTVAALAAATVGFALLAAPAVRSAGASGLALALVAAGLFVALIVLSKPLASVYGGLRLAFIELAGAALFVTPVALAIAWPPLSSSWLWVVAVGVVHTALGITLYLSVLAEIPATHVGILSYLEPVVVVLASWVWLGQRPVPATALGGFLIVAAGVSLARWGADPGARTSAPGPTGAMKNAPTAGTIDAVVPSPR